MRYLLDTHSLIWFIGGDSQLGSEARGLIDDEENEIYVSIASLWEMAIKYSNGKLNLGEPFEDMFPKQLEINSIEILDIAVNHLKVTAKLPFHHRDPFDRLIIAQATIERMPIISVDEVFDDYGVERIRA